MLDQFFLDFYKKEKNNIKEVLDVGTGKGTYALFLSSNGANVEAIDIVDSSEIFINSSGIKFTQETILTYAIKKNYFDLIIMRSVLHYLKPDEVQKIAFRIMSGLKNGAFLYIETMTPSHEDRYLHLPLDLVNMFNGLYLREKVEEVREIEKGKNHFYWHLIFVKR